MWELPDETTTPRLAEALDAAPGGRADRAFELALAAFLAHARACSDREGARDHGAARGHAP